MSSSFIVQGTLSQERMPRPERTWGCGGKFPQASPDSLCCCCPWLQTPPSWHRSLGRKSKSGRFIANMYIVVVGDSWYCQIIITHSMEKQQSIETNMSQHASDSEYLFFYRPHCLLEIETYMSCHIMQVINTCHARLTFEPLTLKLFKSSQCVNVQLPELWVIVVIVIH